MPSARGAGAGCPAPTLLAAKHVLITAGRTFEPIDPVRGITNRSSGKMGYAIARAALDAGAKVTLVSGPTSLGAPAAARGTPRFGVGSAAESQKLHENADAKRRRKKVPLMVANLAQDAIGADDNKVTLLDDSGIQT